MRTITQSFHCDYAHRIMDHESKCRFLHGHRATIEMVFQSLELDGIGRVLDFGEIKSLIGNWINDNLDHNCILNIHDPLLNCQLPEKKFYILTGNPTAEVLARNIYLVVENLLALHHPHVHITQLRFWETPNSSAVYP